MPYRFNPQSRLIDYYKDHDIQTNPILHAVATPSANGFMSSVDKTKLDAATSVNTPSTIVQRSGSGLIELTTTQLNGLTSGNIQINAADITTSYSIKLPSAQGVANSFITNDGAGNLSWQVLSTNNIDGGKPNSIFVAGLNVIGGTP